MKINLIDDNVILNIKDPTVQDLLWEYAQRTHSININFSNDLKQALLNVGYQPDFVIGPEFRY